MKKNKVKNEDKKIFNFLSTLIINMNKKAQSLLISKICVIGKKNSIHQKQVSKIRKRK